MPCAFPQPLSNEAGWDKFLVATVWKNIETVFLETKAHNEKRSDVDKTSLTNFVSKRAFSSNSDFFPGAREIFASLEIACPEIFVSQRLWSIGFEPKPASAEKFGVKIEKFRRVGIGGQYRYRSIGFKFSLDLSPG